MRKVLILTLFVVIYSLSLHSQTAEASLLRLYADPSTYINSNPDPWWTESWGVLGTNTFDLQVINDYAAKTDPNVNTIQDVYLVLTVLEATKNAGFTVQLNGTTLDETDFSSNGDHPRIPRHGVFGDGTYYAEYYIGDLSPQEIFELTVISGTPSEYPVLHFDAYGDLVQKGGGGEGYRLNPITNPFSKDVTNDHTPEPVTLLLFGTGVFGFAFFRRKK